MPEFARGPIRIAPTTETFIVCQKKLIFKEKYDFYYYFVRKQNISGI